MASIVKLMINTSPISTINTIFIPQGKIRVLDHPGAKFELNLRLPSAPKLELESPVSFGISIPDGLVLTRFVDITNNSKRAGNFRIDYAGDQPIKIFPCVGTIEPGSSRSIKVGSCIVCIPSYLNRVISYTQIAVSTSTGRSYNFSFHGEESDCIMISGSPLFFFVFLLLLRHPLQRF